MKNKQLLTQLSPEDARDYTSTSVKEEITELPDKFVPEERQQVFFQAFSSQCVAHAIVTMIQYCEQKQGKVPNNYSRGFIYANRNGEDMNVSGMYPRKALKIFQKEGTCPYYSFRWGQSSLSRVIKKFEERQVELEDEALNYTVIDSYYRLYSFDELKQAIYNNGAAIISVPCWAMFLYQKKVNPRDEYESKHSNHCMCAIGWDGDYIICQDSYSPLAHFNGGLVYIHKDYAIREMWSVKLKDREIPRIQVNGDVKYWGYIGYVCEWLFGGIIEFFKNKCRKGRE